MGFPYCGVRGEVCGHGTDRQDFVQRYDMSVVVSVEARRYADGCMELQYDRIPGQGHRAAAKIGIETRTGQLDLHHETYFGEGRDMAGRIMIAGIVGMLCVSLAEGVLK